MAELCYRDLFVFLQTVSRYLLSNMPMVLLAVYAQGPQVVC